MQVPVKQRFPRWWQALLIIGGSIVLGISSCAGVLNGMGGSNSGNGSLAIVFAGIFLASLAGTLAGFVLMLIVIARAIVNALALPPAASQPIDVSSPTLQADPRIAGPGSWTIGARPSQTSDDLRVVRRFQIMLVIVMILPLATLSSYMAPVLRNPATTGRYLSKFLVSYVFAQAPYLFALLRSRRGPDRLAAVVAFASSCVFFVESILPFVQTTNLVAYGFLGFLFGYVVNLIGVVLVAVFSWQMGKLCQREEDDLAVLGASFIGVIVYLAAVRYFDVHMSALIIH